MLGSTTAVLSVFSLLAGISQAADSSNDPVSFSSFGGIGVSNPPAACQTAFQQSIPGCSVSDFVKNNPCSNACIVGLVSASNNIKSKCSGISPADGPLKAALEGTIVNGLCPNAVVSAQSVSIGDSTSTAQVLTSSASAASVSVAAARSSTNAASPSTSSTSSPSPSASAASEVRASAQSVPTSVGIVSDTAVPPTAASTLAPSSLVVPSGSIVPLPTPDPAGGATPFDNSAAGLRSMGALPKSFGGLFVVAAVAVVML